MAEPDPGLPLLSKPEQGLEFLIAPFALAGHFFIKGLSRLGFFLSEMASQIRS